MKRVALVGVLMAGLAGGWAFAQTSSQQSPPPNTDSLADYARKLREQQKTSQPGSKPAKVYTNDDVQQLQGTSGVSAASTPVAPATTETASGGHNKKYFQKEYGKLLAQKQIHERQLEVLQEKLGQNNIQYYPDPNKTLIQQSTPRARSDINQLQADIDAKKLEIQKDDEAISNLQDQLRRDGGDAGWLREPLPPDSLSAENPPETEEEANPKDKKRTREYWQTKFRALRANLKQAEEVQKLLQDEVELLQRRQVIEMSADAQTEITQKLATRQAELNTSTTTLEKIRKQLDDLQEEFDASGAPSEWSVTEEAPSGS